MLRLKLIDFIWLIARISSVTLWIIIDVINRSRTTNPRYIVFEFFIPFSFEIVLLPSFDRILGIIWICWMKIAKLEYLMWMLKLLNQSWTFCMTSIISIHNWFIFMLTKFYESLIPFSPKIIKTNANTQNGWICV